MERLRIALRLCGFYLGELFFPSGAGRWAGNQPRPPAAEPPVWPAPPAGETSPGPLAAGLAEPPATEVGAAVRTLLAQPHARASEAVAGALWRLGFGVTFYPDVLAACPRTGLLTITGGRRADFAARAAELDLDPGGVDHVPPLSDP